MGSHGEASGPRLVRSYTQSGLLCVLLRELRCGRIDTLNVKGHRIVACQATEGSGQVVYVSTMSALENVKRVGQV